MKYQIYLQKDVSEIINKIAQALNQAPSTLIKNYLETNFREAYTLATTEERKEVMHG